MPPNIHNLYNYPYRGEYRIWRHILLWYRRHHCSFGHCRYKAPHHCTLSATDTQPPDRSPRTGPTHRTSERRLCISRCCASRPSHSSMAASCRVRTDTVHSIRIRLMRRRRNCIDLRRMYTRSLDTSAPWRTHCHRPRSFCRSTPCRRIRHRIWSTRRNPARTSHSHRFPLSNTTGRTSRSS